MFLRAAVPLRIIVADDDAASRARLVDQLTSSGHLVVAETATGADAVTRALVLGPDVVLLDLRLPEGPATEAAASIARMESAPGVVFLTGEAESALSDDEVGSTHACCVLAKSTPLGLLEATVRLAAARAKEAAAARTEVAAARRQLTERKLIERAKGILMRRTGASEQECYHILQRSSHDKATPMVELAQAVLDSEPGAARAAARAAGRA